MPKNSVKLVQRDVPLVPNRVASVYVEQPEQPAKSVTPEPAPVQEEEEQIDTSVIERYREVTKGKKWNLSLYPTWLGEKD